MLSNKRITTTLQQTFFIAKKTIWLFLPCVFVTCLLVLTGCNSSDEETVTLPENILTQQKFTQLLVSYALAESAANMNVKNVPSYKMDTVYAFNPLVENNVRRGQYDSTLAFYIKRPKLYKQVYDEVLAQLAQMQTRRDGVRAVAPAGKP